MAHKRCVTRKIYLDGEAVAYCDASVWADGADGAVRVRSWKQLDDTPQKILIGPPGAGAPPAGAFEGSPPEGWWAVEASRDSARGRRGRSAGGARRTQPAGRLAPAVPDSADRRELVALAGHPLLDTADALALIESGDPGVCEALAARADLETEVAVALAGRGGRAARQALAVAEILEPAVADALIAAGDPAVAAVLAAHPHLEASAQAALAAGSARAVHAVLASRATLSEQAAAVLAERGDQLTLGRLMLRPDLPGALRGTVIDRAGLEVLDLAMSLSGPPDPGVGHPEVI